MQSPDDFRISSALHKHLEETKAMQAAVIYALLTEGSYAELEERISEMSKPTQIEIDNTNPYKEAYLAALKQLSQQAHQAENRDEYEMFLRNLRRQNYATGGEVEALEFAIQQGAQIGILHAEIEHHRGIIKRNLKKRPNGAMAPNASPRKFKDAYIAGLLKTINIVESVSNETQEP